VYGYPLNGVSYQHVTTGERVYRQVGDFERKEAAFRGEDERLCWAMSKTVNNLKGVNTNGREERGDVRERRGEEGVECDSGGLTGSSPMSC
jgi:hypothetical protein